MINYFIPKKLAWTQHPNHSELRIINVKNQKINTINFLDRKSLEIFPTYILLKNKKTEKLDSLEVKIFLGGLCEIGELQKTLFRENKKNKTKLPEQVWMRCPLKNEGPELYQVSRKTMRVLIKILEKEELLEVIPGEQFKERATLVRPTQKFRDNFVPQYRKSIRDLTDREIIAKREQRAQKHITIYTEKCKELMFRMNEKTRREGYEIKHQTYFRKILPSDFHYVRTVFDAQDKLHGRFYARFQKIKKEERKKLKWKGLEAHEIDISSSHIQFAYALSGKKMPEGDAYALEDITIDRDVIKKIANCLFTTSNKHNAILAIVNEMRTDYKQTKQVIEALMEKHSEIKDCFFTNYYPQLFWAESETILNSTLSLLNKNINVLIIHDALMIFGNNIEETINTMKEEFKLLFKNASELNIKLNY